MRIRHPLACALWSRVWRKWLYKDFYGTHSQAVIVLGWRTAIVEDVTKTGRRINRYAVTPMFRWERLEPPSEGGDA